MTSTGPSLRLFLRFLTGRRTLLISAPFSRGVMAVISTSSNHRVWSRFNFQLSFAHPRRLSVVATAAMSLALCLLRSVPLGKYWRSKPLVFSFVPRCHGLRGSQKKTCSPVSIRS